MSTNEFDRLMSSEQLKKIADFFSEEALLLVDNYRTQQELEVPQTDAMLKKAVMKRAEEIMKDPDHTRPNGTEGMDIPYEFGYDEKKETLGELVGTFSNESLKYLIQKGPHAIVDALLRSDEEMLKEQDVLEHAIGVSIEETKEDYRVSFVYISSRQKEQERLEEKDESNEGKQNESLDNTSSFTIQYGPKLTKEPKTNKEVLVSTTPVKKVNRKRLASLYNQSLKDDDNYDYTSPLYGELMLVRASIVETIKEK